MLAITPVVNAANAAVVNLFKSPDSIPAVWLVVIPPACVVVNAAACAVVNAVI
jgi:hypothetical protein